MTRKQIDEIMGMIKMYDRMEQNKKSMTKEEKYVNAKKKEFEKIKTIQHPKVNITVEIFNVKYIFEDYSLYDGYRWKKINENGTEFIEEIRDAKELDNRVLKLLQQGWREVTKFSLKEWIS